MTSTLISRRLATSLQQQQRGLNFPTPWRPRQFWCAGVKRDTASRRPPASPTTRMCRVEASSATRNHPILTRIRPRTVRVGFRRTLERGYWQKRGHHFSKVFQRLIPLTCSARGRSLAKNLTPSRSSSQFSEERGPARNWNAAKNAGSIVKSSGNTFRSINDK